jgi:hypothetical protein
VVLFLIGCSFHQPISQPVDPCEQVSLDTPYVHSAQASEVKTWHHDCSNTTGFEYTEIPSDIPMNSWSSWTHVEADLESNGQALHVPSIPSIANDTYFYFGPMYVYDLPASFPISGLRNFSVQIELNNTNPEYCGTVEVGLFDESYTPIVMAECSDTFSDKVKGYCTSMYYLRNISLHKYILNNEESYEYGLFQGSWLQSINMSWTIWYEPEQGVAGNIPAYGPLSGTSGVFVPESVAESAREVKYLVLLFGGYNKDGVRPIPPFYVHDIFLEYETGGLIDNTVPIIHPASDIICYPGQNYFTVEWNTSDDNPRQYWVATFLYAQDAFSDIYESGPWNGSGITASIHLSPSYLTVGSTHTVALIVQDQGGLLALDKINVTVTENPTLQMIRSFAPALVLSIVVVVACFLYTRKGSRR